MLVTLGVCVVGASTLAAAANPVRPRVLGQSNRTPAVIGQPAPTGTGDLDAVSCADAKHCWAVGTPPSRVPSRVPRRTQRIGGRLDLASRVSGICH